MFHSACLLTRAVIQFTVQRAALLIRIAPVVALVVVKELLLVQVVQLLVLVVMLAGQFVIRAISMESLELKLAN